MTIGDRIKKRREQLDMSQYELALKLGYKSRSSINKIELGLQNLTQSKIKSIADALDTTPSYIMGWTDDDEQPLPDNIIPMPKMKKIPLVGEIACGTPILAVENLDGTVEVPETIHADFALRCKGDSMINARIYDGDIVYIRQQPVADNGQIAAVLIGDEATLKRVKIYNDHVVLEPENPQYKPIVYWDADVKNVQILGVAVAFTSAVI